VRIAVVGAEGQLGAAVARECHGGPGNNVVVEFTHSMLDVTSDFVYVRLHGDVKIYTSGYSSRALAAWARRIRAWDEDGRDVYVYFDNDVKVRAPFDALNLMHKLDLEWQPPPDNELPLHTAGVRVPGLKFAYGPRVTGGNPAWEKLGRR
jgi:uncharacterized protein YecE (DUF72 family)